jgi:hypothetical protein
LIESDLASPEHSAWMRALIQEQAPGAAIRVFKAGASFGPSLAILSQALQEKPAVLVFGYGHRGFDAAEWSLLRQAWEQGTVIVAPAGNDGGHAPWYPASYPAVLGVGGAGANGGPAKGASAYQGVKLLAGSENLEAPANSGLPGRVSGSSYAAAAVAGAAAHLASEGMLRDEIELALKKAGRGPRGPRAASLASARRLARQKPKPRTQAAKPNALAAQGNLALLLPSRPGKALRLRLSALGGRPLQDFGEGGLVAQAGDGVLARLNAEGLLEASFRSEVGAAAMAGLSAPRRVAAGVWNDSFLGQAALRLPEADLESGAAILGCTDEPSPDDLASGPNPLQPMGLFIPSPPLDGAPASYTSEFMAGRVAVGVILVQSNGSIDASLHSWTPTQEANVLAKISSATAFLAAQNPAAKLQFAFEIHSPADCDYEPITHPFSDNITWQNNALLKLGYANVGLYNAHLRSALNADWAYTIYVADDTGCPSCNGTFVDGRFAYASLGGGRVVMTYDNDGWGIGRMDNVCAHESAHMFGALDEYSSGQPAYTQSGYFNQANDNAFSGGSLHDGLCIMRGYGDLATADLCQASWQHVGWRDQDADGITDVLDTAASLSWSAGTPLSVLPGTSLTLHGSGADQPLAPLSPYLPAATINGITLVNYRLNGGPWTAAALDHGGSLSHEGFSFPTGAINASTLVEVQAVNSSGNTGTALSLSLAVTTATPSTTRTNSPTSSATRTATPTPSISPTFSFSPTASPTRTASPTISPTPPGTLTATPTFSESDTFTDSPTPSPTSTATPSGTVSPPLTSTQTRTITPVPCWAQVGGFGTGSNGSGPGELGVANFGAAVDSQYLYVFDDSNIRIEIFDKFSRAYVDQISIGGVAISIDGGRIFVGTSGGQVRIYDQATRAFITSFGSSGTGNGQFTQAIFMDFDANYVYVLDQKGSRVEVFDKFSYAYVGQFGNGMFSGNVFGLAVINGRCYVSDSNPSSIFVFDTGTYASVGTITGFAQQGQLAEDGHYLYVSDLNNHRVVVIDPSNNNAVNSTFSTGTFRPMGIATDGAGVFVAMLAPLGMVFYPCSIAPTFTVTPSFSASPTPSSSPTFSPTKSPSFTLSPTFSLTPEEFDSGVLLVVTATPTWTESPLPSPSPSETPDVTATPSPTTPDTLTQTPDFTASSSPTLVSTLTQTPDSTASASPTEPDTLTQTPDFTASFSPTLVSTLTQTPDFTASFSPTLVSTLTHTPDSTASFSPTLASTLTQTPDFTASFSPTLVSTLTHTPDFTASASPTPPNSPTFTLTGTPTPSVSPSFSPSPTFSVSPTRTPTFSHSPSPGPTALPAAGDVVAPVPAWRAQPFRLFVAAGESSSWKIYSAAGELVDTLNFGSGETAEWTHQGRAAGIYLARIEIKGAGGPRVIWRKLALLP